MSETLKNFSVEERREHILELLERQKKVRVNELKELFGTSEVTIRGDLAELERKRCLERIHGGAIKVNRLYDRLNFDERLGVYTEEKRAIARRAAKFVEEEDTLFINSGTTTRLLAEELKGFRDLTILTNSMYVAQALRGSIGCNVVLLGGVFNDSFGFTYGDDTLAQIRRYKARRCLISVDGVSSAFGLSTRHFHEAEVNRLIMERSSEVVVMADGTKIGRENFVSIAPISEVDVLVTNSSSDRDELNDISAHGINVVLADE